MIDFSGYFNACVIAFFFAFFARKAIKLFARFAGGFSSDL